jgi:hypothetical protein
MSVLGPGIARAARAALLAVVLPAMASGAGCESTAVMGKVVDGPSSMVILADEGDERFEGPGIQGAEAELRAVRDGLGDRLITKSVAGLDGSFRIGVVDRLTSETLYLIVSRPGYITAKGPASISADGKQMLIVLKKVAR